MNSNEKIVKDKLAEILMERHFGYRSISSYEIESSDATGTTYKVTFKEVVCGVSGNDTDWITLPHRIL